MRTRGRRPAPARDTGGRFDEEALRLHPYYRGKIEIVPKCPIRDVSDFSVWYTPGVAAPCREIAKDPSRSFDHTNRANLIAVVSNGTRVLGLGDIGPEAGLPVMEGKALIFKYLGGVDAFPLVLREKDPARFIAIVRALEPSFGGINLEDIAQPGCYEILDTLRATMEIPVWHDDQQGTAAVTVAGFINAVSVVGKKHGNVRIALIGAGAANMCIARLLIAFGADPGKLVLCDTKGILGCHRTDLQPGSRKAEMAARTNVEGRQGGPAEAMRGADVVVACSTPVPGTITKEMVRGMASDPIVFACANPQPEIWPWDAKEAGAAVVATGRSDFPNQVNNSLVFPGVFRGALDVRAKGISDEMCLEASRELARLARGKNGRVSPEKILPTMDEWTIYPRMAVAVGMMAQEQGLARVRLSKEALHAKASATIKRARNEAALLFERGVIPKPPRVRSSR